MAGVENCSNTGASAFTPLTAATTFDHVSMRRVCYLILRIFTNARTVLSENQSTLLSNTLKTLALTCHVSCCFVQSLAEDLLGASRLPAVAAGTRLASAHEAALATRCIGLLAQHSPPVRRMMLAANQTSAPTLEVLKRNQEVHLDFVVWRETKKIYSVLSQDLRTCY